MSAAARCTLALVALITSATGAQTTKSRNGAAMHAAVAGVVRDSLGNPISGATVFVDAATMQAVSDDSGHFVIRGLAAGRNGFTITRIGFAPVSFETSLIPDSMIVLSVRMRSIQSLDPVRVTALRVNAYLARTGFMDRKRLGTGSYLSPERLDSLAPTVTTPAQLLRGVRGVDVRCQRADCVVHAHEPPDCFWLFVDGAPLGTDQIDVIGLTPSGIAAVEVYERASIVPTEFQGALPRKRGGMMSLSAGCGAIAVWTKSRVP